MAEEKKLLLHICCAPCGAGCVNRQEMSTANREVVLFYSNSNLDSIEEFDKRLNEVKKLAEFYHLPLIIDPYDHQAWLAAVGEFAGEPEGGKRCRKCFEFNLSRAAQFAKEGNFATTLTVSPRKSSRTIFEAASRWENFEKIDFKKKNGYLIGRNFAVEHGFYRQNYCGCEFSRRQTAANESEDNV